MKSLFGITTNWSELLKNLENSGGGDWGWVQTLMGVLSTVLWVILALVGAAGGIYAVYVGIKMARADSAEAREENKKRLINLIITIVVVIVLIIFFNTFLPMIIGAFTVDGDIGYKVPPEGNGNAVATAAKVLLRLPW